MKRGSSICYMLQSVVSTCLDSGCKVKNVQNKHLILSINKHLYSNCITSQVPDCLLLFKHIGAETQEMIRSLFKGYSISQSLPSRTAEDFISPRSESVVFHTEPDAEGDPLKHDRLPPPSSANHYLRIHLSFADMQISPHILSRSVHTNFTSIVTACL